ncbi:hypothetical protein BJ138DRAFT_741471 [Hygrophoropsis aurantiaca]|uniref:Uncharacterized protein n=1 Tax=Hygrophoropsis aurantiaca TaxID=72124 RepID=A0ACB7ZZ62_9AGAM|nr:hypothetical protein BJ138DRAFT_741471 [Hygrophoropsis aurantiaca]
MEAVLFYRSVPMPDNRGHRMLGAFQGLSFVYLSSSPAFVCIYLLPPFSVFLLFLRHSYAIPPFHFIICALLQGIFASSYRIVFWQFPPQRPQIRQAPRSALPARQSKVRCILYNIAKSGVSNSDLQRVRRKWKIEMGSHIDIISSIHQD